MDPRQIRAIRAWLGLSQQELADQLRVTQNTVARWETGNRNPSGPALVVLEQLWDRVQHEMTEVKGKGKAA